jgi:cytochrome P450
MIVNLWAIGCDPKVWNKPLEFDPYWFVDFDINVQGRHYGLLPFESSCQQCPGFDIAQFMVQYGLVVILHAFDWFPQPGVKPKDMNVMEDINGFIFTLVEPLVAVAKPHLPTQV